MKIPDKTIRFSAAIRYRKPADSSVPIAPVGGLVGGIRVNHRAEDGLGGEGDADADRLGCPPDDFEIRIFTGALTGAVLAALDEAGIDGRDPAQLDHIKRAIDYLATGFPLATRPQPRTMKRTAIPARLEGK